MRGIVANVDERMLDEITEFKIEAPGSHFDILHFLRGESWEDFPHQKLVVVDGLLAFKGSANLTVNGWRKAARGLDHIETVTTVNEVIELHNKLFSPVWCSRSGSKKTIAMDVPF